MNEADNNTELSTEQPKDEIAQLLEAEKKRSEEYLNRLKYLQSDLENFRKRCDREIQQATNYSNERIVIQLLDVVDELELAIKTAQSTDSLQAIIDGVQMTLKRLRKVLEQEGVKPIDSKGETFDPSKHNAIISEERDDVEKCIVTEEVRKGYMVKEKVLRPSIVKVAIKRTHNNKKGEKQNESN